MVIATVDPWNPSTPYDPWPPAPTTPWPTTIPAPITTHDRRITQPSTQTPGLKAGNNGLLLHIILDESSSMSSCEEELVDGFNRWLRSMKEDETVDPSKTFVTVTKFNGSNVTTVAEDLPLLQVPELNRALYSPNGMTNLLDAVGTAMERIDSRLRSIRKVSNRPGAFVVVMTDGHENASRRYSKNVLKANVESRTGKDWVFTFIGANIDAFGEGGAMGYNIGTTLQYNVNDMGATFDSLASNTRNVRGAIASGASGVNLVQQSSFTASERAQAVGEGDGGL